MRLVNFKVALDMHLSKNNHLTDCCFKTPWYSWSQNSKYSLSFPFLFVTLIKPIKKVSHYIFYINTNIFTESIVGITCSYVCKVEGETCNENILISLQEFSSNRIVFSNHSVCVVDNQTDAVFPGNLILGKYLINCSKYTLSSETISTRC